MEGAKDNARYTIDWFAFGKERAIQLRILRWYNLREIRMPNKDNARIRLVK